MPEIISFKFSKLKHATQNQASSRFMSDLLVRDECHLIPYRETCARKQQRAHTRQLHLRQCEPSVFGVFNVRVSPQHSGATKETISSAHR